MMYEPNVHDENIPDPYGATQFEQTQQASQSQDIGEAWDETLWGVLKPMHHSHSRIQLKKDRSSLTIGRASDNDIKLPNLKISNRHCEFRWDPSPGGDASVTVLDKSSNGTWINGTKIGRNMSAVLRDGNEIAFGQWSEVNSSDNYRYIFRYVADGPPKDGVYKYYDIGHELGRGSFATVRRGVCRADGKTYAIKMINRNKLRADGQGAVSVFMKEIQILERLHHPNICLLKETFHEPENVVLILEYIDGGDLLDYIINHEGLSEDEARRLAFQLCKALKYIHARGIAHRDLKPENILLTRDDPPILKLADFGLAKAVDSMTRFKTMCGTPIYLAPEVILRNSEESYSHVVDSWSAGVIIFAMIANANPFVDDDASVMAIRFRSRYIDWNLVESRGISFACRRFLERLLEENPAERMTCAEALKDPWLASLSADDPEALDNTPNDSLMSVQANAGSFLDQEYPTPLPPAPSTLPEVPLPQESQPRSQELQGTGISSNFGLIRMDEGVSNENVSPVSATTAASEPEPSAESQQADTVLSTSRGQGRKLSRHAMQIAEYDEDGNLSSFRHFPPSSVELVPVYAGNANGDGHVAESEAGARSSGVEPGNTNGTHDDQDDADDDKRRAGSEPALTPVTEAEDGVLEARTSHGANTRKRSAPTSSEPQDASMSEGAPTKRTRAISADVAA